MKTDNNKIYLLFFLIFCAFAAGTAALFYFNDEPEYLETPIYRENPVKPENKFLKSWEDIKNEFILKETDFLEANLHEMKIRVFKKGTLEREVSILAKGDPQAWGGSAAGIYKILSGNKLSFSNISKVYMPYALHYFGKYYIHGVPYYPGGEKLGSPVSGGCLRLADSDAKEIFELTELNMPVLVIDKEREEFKYEKEGFLGVPEISAESYLLADLDSGFIFSEKNSGNKIQTGDLAKLMEALVVAENVNLERAAEYDGKDLRVVELFYPLLINSSDDAAEALSGFLGKEKTVRLMNEKAKGIMMENTFFDSISKSGGNISTAEDLFYLARQILNTRHPLFDISKGKRVVSFGGPFFNIGAMRNYNLFEDKKNFIGGKADASGNSGMFVFSIVKDGEKKNIVFIILNSTELKEGVEKLYSWLYSSYFN
ncbi:MAG: L,D-transpeptidase family protein [bacterium]|nr:L,D-transpeptidase family protein [bacterium]